MSIPYTRKEKAAGLFLMLGILLIFAVAVLVGGGRDWFRSYQNYYAIYNDGYGLAPGVKVKFLRTDVGLVTKLELTDNNKVKVHMSILSDYAVRIKNDSLAAVESPDFYRQRIYRHTPWKPGQRCGAPRRQIPAKERKTIEDLIKDLHLDAMLKRVEAIMVNIDSLTHQLQDPTGPLLGTMSNVRKLTASVVDGEGTIGPADHEK